MRIVLSGYTVVNGSEGSAAGALLLQRLAILSTHWLRQDPALNLFVGARRANYLGALTLATNTTWLPLNFFSSSRTNLW